MKKILALTLAVMMLLSLFAGCSNGGISDTTTGTTTGTSDTTADTTTPEELEPVTLKMYVSDPELEGSADVLEAFNKKLAEVLPNTTLEIVYSSDRNAYFQQWPLLLAGGEEMDIAWFGWSNNLSQDVQDGNVLPLSDLMEQYAPNLLDEKSIWTTDYGAMELDGEQYGIPIIQPIGGVSRSLAIDTELEEYFDVDAIAAELHGSEKTTSRLWDLLDEGFQAAIDGGALTVGDNSWYIKWDTMSYLGCRGYVSFSALGQSGDLVYFYIDPESGTNEILSIYEIPEVVYACERIQSWVDKGWITQSQIAGQYQEGAHWIMNYTKSQNKDWYDRDDRGVMITNYSKRSQVDIACETHEQSYQAAVNTGYSTGMVIPYTSKNPERAMMLLNLLHDKPGTVGNDLANLLVWGFEADSEEAKTYGWANYKLNELEDGTVYADQSYRGEGVSAKHKITDWALSNTYYLMSNGSTSQGKKDFALDFWQNVYPNMKKCAISGMLVSTTNIQDEMSTFKTIIAEYASQINGGAVDKIPELMDKLNSTCLKTIKADLAQQLADYQASK